MGWAYPSLLTWSHVDSGMLVVVVIVVYCVVVWYVSNNSCFYRVRARCGCLPLLPCLTCLVILRDVAAPVPSAPGL